MGYQSATALDLIDDSQRFKADTANMLLAALASAGLFGIRRSVTAGLDFGVYGGVMLIAGTPTVIPNQALTLTASATNYVTADAAGAIAKATSAPTGWPGPLAAGAMALYELVVGASGITSGINYVPSLGGPGEGGGEGAIGPSGSTFFDNAKRIISARGNGSTTIDVYGFGALTASGATARSLSSATFRQSIPYVAFETIAAINSTSNIIVSRDFCFLGDAAGRGGFTCSFRFCFEAGFTATSGKSFFGLMPSTASIGAGVEPDSLTTLVGIGNNSTDGNLCLIHNDASGTATKTLITSDDSPGVNFPARNADRVYELTLSSEPNSGIVSWELIDCENEIPASGSISTNLPANTAFLSPRLWIQNGAASAHCFGLMQIVGETPN